MLYLVIESGNSDQSTISDSVSVRYFVVLSTGEILCTTDTYFTFSIEPGMSVHLGASRVAVLLSTLLTFEARVSDLSAAHALLTRCGLVGGDHVILSSQSTAAYTRESALAAACMRSVHGHGCGVSTAACVHEGTRERRGLGDCAGVHGSTRRPAQTTRSMCRSAASTSSSGLPGTTSMSAASPSATQPVSPSRQQAAAASEVATRSSSAGVSCAQFPKTSRPSSSCGTVM